MSTLTTSWPGRSLLVRILQALHPLPMLRNLWRHRAMTRQFAWREVQGRYQGSYLGLFWSFINPLLMLLVFTFVFGVVFKSRWHGAGNDQSLAQFAVIMFAGQMAFTVFGDPVGRAASLITGNSNYVKKVIFPLEILPVAAVLSALFHAGVSVLLLIGANLVVSGTVHATALLLPLVLLPLVLAALGVSWVVASLGVYLRDVGQVVTILLQVLFFASPVFYAIEVVPEAYRVWMHANPLSIPIESVRACLLFGHGPDLATWGLQLGVSAVIAILGHAWFTITRKGFADVI